MDFQKFQNLVEHRTGFQTMDNPMASGEYFSDSCGDMYTYYLKVGPGDVIEDVSYFTTGCGFGTATCSLLVDLALGKTLDEAYAISDADIEAQLDGYPEKKKDYPERSRLALQAAIDDFRAKRAAGKIDDEMLTDAARTSARLATQPGNGRTSQDELAEAAPETVPAATDDDKVLIKLH
ncbi:MAG: iron-sulfur cluster assembly scaffold protein [Candidatus Eremiobacteraeota bacterium]|nr:iron-sulfur cluster assembly scaffold protein [Candidatus Eremiobacteraeota bacterium]